MKFPIKELRQKEADLNKERRAIYASAKGRGGDGNLTTAELQRVEDIAQELAENSIALSTVEGAMDEERAEGARTGAPVVDWSDKPGGARRGAESSRSNGRKFNAIFPDASSAPQGGGGFKSFEDFMAAIHNGGSDSRLVSMTGASYQAALGGHGEKFPSEGGFFVPEEFAAEKLDAALEQEIVRPRARVFPMTSRTKKIVGFANEDNSGSAPYGGFNIAWLDEGDATTTKKTKTRALELTAHRAALYTESSDELIEDGLSFEEMLGEALIESMAWGLDDAFLNGSGAGQPKGILNDSALIAVAKESGQAADTIQYENLVNMLARLHPSGFKNSFWLANPTTIPQLLTMNHVVRNAGDTDNVGGSHIPVMSEGGDGQFKILTRPVLLTEKVPVLGDLGDIALVDFSQYAIGMRRQVAIQSSQHVKWSTGEMSYRLIVRVDGQGRWAKAFTPKKGATQSWCVTLAARA